MSSVNVVAILVAVAILLTTIATIVVICKRQSMKNANRIWRQFADQLHGELMSETLFTVNAPAVRFVLNGSPAQIDYVGPDRRSGNLPCIRLHTTWPDREFMLEVFPRRLSIISKMLGIHEFKTGSTTFDKNYIVWSNDFDTARQLLSEDVQLEIDRLRNLRNEKCPTADEIGICIRQGEISIGLGRFGFRKTDPFLERYAKAILDFHDLLLLKCRQRVQSGETPPVSARKLSGAPMFDILSDSGGGARIRDALNSKICQDIPIQPAAKRFLGVLTLLTTLGLVCFFAGIHLIGRTLHTTFGLVLAVLGPFLILPFLVLSVAGLLCDACGARTTALESSALPIGDRMKSFPRGKRLGRIVAASAGAIIIVLLFVAMFLSIGHFEYRRRPKPDTVGYAELNTGNCIVRFELPYNWRISYYSRKPPSFYQGRIRDDQDQPRLDVYGTLQGGDLQEYARLTAAGYAKARIQLEWSEYRETLRGCWWVFAVRTLDKDPFFKNQPLIFVGYTSERGVRLQFTMLASEAAELEPRVWELVQTAEVHFSTQFD